MKPIQLYSKKVLPHLTEDVLIRQRTVRSLINKNKSNNRILRKELNLFVFHRERKDGFNVNKATSDLDNTKT